MKNKGTRAITAIVISLIMILSTIYFPKQASAATQPEIYLDPSNNTFYTDQTSIGTRFNVTAWVQNAPEIGAWQVVIEFNDSILNVTRWFEPKTDPQYIFTGKTTTAFPAPPNPKYEHISAGNARFQVMSSLLPTPPDQDPSSGNGKLCMIEFVVTQTPTSGNLSCSLRLTGSLPYYPTTTLLDPDGNDVSGVIKDDGTYTLAFNVAHPPNLAVNPPETTITPVQNTTGQGLTLGVFVNEVSPSVSLKTVSLSLSYNQSLLSIDPTNVTLDSLWSSGNSVTVSEGLINITVANPTATPSGSVLVGNATFAIIRETSPPVPLGSNSNTTLDFVYSLLLNSTGGEIAQSSSTNGLVRIYAYQTEVTPLTLTEPTVVGFGKLIVPGKGFQVNVTLGEVFGFSEADMYIAFNQSIINCTNIQTGDEFGYTSLRSSEINDTSGYLRAIVDSSGRIPVVFSGPILTLTFTAETQGTSFLNFSQPYGTDTSVKDSTNTMIAVRYVERIITVTSGNVSNIAIASSQVPGFGIIGTANGSITLKQQGPIIGSANVTFVMNDTEGLAIAPSDFQVTLNTSDTFTQPLIFTNTGINTTKSITVKIQVIDATDGTLTDERTLIIQVLAIGTETATLKITVKIKDTGKAVENANVTVTSGGSNRTVVTDADGIVTFDMSVVTSGNVTVSVQGTSSYYADSENITMHSGLNEYTIELVGKMVAETDYTIYLVIIILIVIVVVGIAGFYLYKRRQLHLREE